MFRDIVAIYLLSLVVFIVSYTRNREKTRRCIELAITNIKKSIPAVITVVVIIYILSGQFDPESIKKYSDKNKYRNIIAISLAGSLVHLPVLILYPVLSEMVGKADIEYIVAVLASVYMVRLMSFPLEAKIVDKKIAFWRNLFNFISVILISIMMGYLYNV